MYSKLFSIGAILLLSACGGDDSSTPAPANRPPTFTSASTVTTPENNTVVVYTATATDPEGIAVTYAIAGGLDAAAFRITADGKLSFVVAPDFERPGNVNHDNIYRVQISANDGMATTMLTVDVTVTNLPDLISVRRVATGFVQPLALTAYPDGSNKVAVVEKGGRIRLLTPATGETFPFLDISAQVSTLGDRGLLGVAFAPDYRTSGAFYVYMNNTAGAVEVRRYRAQLATAQADPTSSSLVMTFTMPSEFHQGGFIAFGPDNYLYIGTGDGVADRADAEATFGQGDFRGKILKIDPTKDDFPADPTKNYGIAPDHPINTVKEMWANGFRNLNHASFDPVTKDLWMSDSGQTAREEVDRLLDGWVANLSARTPRAPNYGWSHYEGTQVFNPFPGLTGCCEAPVYEFSDGTPLQAGAVVGGYVYRGPISSLQGQYFFADGANLYSFALTDVPMAAGTTGGAAGIAASAVKLRNADFTPDAGSFTAITAFGTDVLGQLFIVDGSGAIFIIEGK